MLQEHDEEEPEKEYKYTVIENDREANIQPMEYRQPEGDHIRTVKSAGMVKKCYQHPEGREWAVESDRPIDFNQEGSWTWDEEDEEGEVVAERVTSAAHGARPKLQGVKVYR